MKTAILIGLLLLAIGWLAHDVYSVAYEKPSIFVSKERISPSDRIQDSDLLMYEDRIIIKVNDANWAKYTDTNSMDPLLDVNSVGIEVQPKSELDLQIGDVVSYQASWTDGLVCHRIIDIGYDKDGWYAITKGDNTSVNDPNKVRFEQIKYVLVGVLY
ncbi:hypothetical protein J4438_00185 [Candidatus Woesearchaeota archaeon]|nr:hypothetical protein [Candidatus Woesearchaeota archaeon]